MDETSFKEWTKLTFLNRLWLTKYTADMMWKTQDDMERVINEA
jgi:hypothetical protein